MSAVWSSGPAAPDSVQSRSKTAVVVTKAASAEAAQRIAPRVPSIREDVLTWIRNRGSQGGTCDELELATGLTHQTASARVHELMKQGKIEHVMVAGKALRRKTRSGSPATVWVATPETGS